MCAAALENMTDHRQDVWCAHEVEFDQEHQIDEIADARVEPVAVVTGQSVKLLGEVLGRRSNLDLRRGEPIERGKRTRHLQLLGRKQLFCSRGNVEANRGNVLPAMLAVRLKRKPTSRA